MRTNFPVRPIRARGWAFNRNFGPIVPKVPREKNLALILITEEHEAMTNHDDPGLTEEQKRSQQQYNRAWSLTKKQAIDLQRFLSPLSVADLYMGIGIAVALAAVSPQELAKTLRLQADELE